MDAAARERLGPMRERLGSLFQMPLGTVIGVSLGIAVLVLVIGMVVVGVSGVALLFSTGESFRGASVALFLLVTVLPVLLLLVALAVVVAALIEYRRTFVHVHVNGLEIRQPWFTHRVILWEDVTAMVAPVQHVWSWPFFIHLGSGRRQLVSRLCIAPVMRGHSGVTHHPDVVMVFDHYRQWCHTHGREPNILE